jgi:hypothetical protein
VALRERERERELGIALFVLPRKQNPVFEQVHRNFKKKIQNEKRPTDSWFRCD